MSIFSYEQTFKDIQQGKESIALICLKCKHNMAVTNYSSFGCQNCQTRYTFESYQLQFNSMFMSLLLNGSSSVGAGASQQQTTGPTQQTPKVETPPTTKEPETTSLSNMFDEIYSFEDIKRLIKIVLQSDRSLHCLITGPPGQGKTVFLDCVKALYPDESEYLDSTMLTKAGLGAYLQKSPKLKILLLDELDKLPTDQQMILLNLLQKQVLRIEKHNKSIDMKFPNLKVIATGNDVEKIYYAVRDRFKHIHMDTYTKDEFYFIADKILSKKYKFKAEFVKVMIDQAYEQIQNLSMRGLEQIAQALEVEGQTIENLKYHIKMNSKYDSPI